MDEIDIRAELDGGLYDDTANGSEEAAWLPTAPASAVNAAQAAAAQTTPRAQFKQEPFDEDGDDVDPAEEEDDDDNEDEEGGEGTPSETVKEEVEKEEREDPAVLAHARLRMDAEAAGVDVEDVVKYNEYVLKRAARIRYANKLGSQSAWSEGKRTYKTHWEHVMDEMEWLAKDFTRERAWKLKEMKRYATKISKSNLGLEARVEHREKQKLEDVRKKASWIAKEISSFWSKANRVVSTKVAVQVEAKKKQVMDKHLDLIVGQTEKYSKMLAKNLTGGTEEKKTIQPKIEAPQVKQEVDHSDANVPKASGESKHEVEEGAEEEAEEEEGPPVESIATSRKRRRTGGTRASVAAQKAKKKAKPVGDEDEYEGGTDSEDNEATLEEEADYERNNPELVKKEQAEELNGLDEEAELPLEELLRRYGYEVPQEGDQIKDDDDDEEEEEEKEKEEAEEDGEGQADGEAAGDESACGSAPAVAADEGAEGLVESSDDEGGEDGTGNGAAVMDTEEAAGAPDSNGGKDAAAVKDSVDAAGAQNGGVSAGTVKQEAQVKAQGDDAAPISVDSPVAEGKPPPTKVEVKEGEEGKEGKSTHKVTFAEVSKSETEGVEGEEGKEGKSTHKVSFADVSTSKAEGEECKEGKSEPKVSFANGSKSKAEGEEGKAAKMGPGDGASTDVVDPAATAAGTDEERLEAFARDAIAAQPTGFTLETTQVLTKVPFLLKYGLREYQHIGLDWLVTIYRKRLNGILADEMGLGKTIQTISLLAWMACEEGCWGPHLIVVPTSVMLNWEMELKKWCPAFKLLTYYGSAKERKAKRNGWSKPNAFHVCITSYTIVLQDAKMFRRKKWKYLILDEAHMIKNWKSQRWQTLLRFNSKRRLLITGTPLQNDLMELWSLMHFLMPTVFSSHDQFKDWFCNPLTGMVEGSETYNRQLVERLHGVLRPFLLRRLKCDVEKQMPKKHEHIVRCRLSKRQRLLYEDYMAASDTVNMLSSGNYLGIINVLMQLRKVCNHPDLFEGRQIVSAFDVPPLNLPIPSSVLYGVMPKELECVNLASHGLLLTARDLEPSWAQTEGWRLQELTQVLLQAGNSTATDPSGVHSASPLIRAAAVAGGHANGEGGAGGAAPATGQRTRKSDSFSSVVQSSKAYKVLAGTLLKQQQQYVAWRYSRLELIATLNASRCAGPGVADVARSGGVVEDRHVKGAMFSSDTVLLLQRVANSISRCLNTDSLSITERPGRPVSGQQVQAVGCRVRLDFLPPAARAIMARQLLPSLVLELAPSYIERAEACDTLLKEFLMFIPKARTSAPTLHCVRPDSSIIRSSAKDVAIAQQTWYAKNAALRTALIRGQLFFPDRKLIQYDCGKLQELAALLRRLKPGGHRCLIFTQMSKMLDVLEVFLNLNGHTYMRLDGSTKPEQRQILMTRFNSDTKVFCFILSTRSGGVGINLTGADTVVFYDSDWNPAMDQQAQDRCHRIGQTREVHIYRLVSEKTIEENILQKSDQKRQLDFLAIQSGGFTTDNVLKSINISDLLGNGDKLPVSSLGRDNSNGPHQAPAPTAEEIKAAMRSAEDEADAAAAMEADKEQAEEQAEFTNDPVATATEGEEGADAEEGDKEGVEPKPVKTASDKAADDQALTLAEAGLVPGAAMSAVNLLQQLEASLNPVEKYAVRLLEELNAVDASAAVAALDVVEVNEDDWDLEELQRRKEEHEEEAEDSDEGALVEDWDKEDAADTYREYADMVQRQIVLDEAAEAEYLAALAEQEAQAAQAAKEAAEAGAAAEAAGLPPPSPAPLLPFIPPPVQSAADKSNRRKSGAGTKSSKGKSGKGKSRRASESSIEYMDDLDDSEEEEDEAELDLGDDLDVDESGMDDEDVDGGGMYGKSFGSASQRQGGVSTSGRRGMADANMQNELPPISWLLSGTSTRPHVIPWNVSWDKALCTAVTSAVSAASRKTSQQGEAAVTLPSLPWSSLSKTIGEMTASPAGAITPESSKTRYGQLLAAFLAGHGILPAPALAADCRNRLASNLGRLSSTQLGALRSTLQRGSSAYAHQLQALLFELLNRPVGGNMLNHDLLAVTFSDAEQVLSSVDGVANQRSAPGSAASQVIAEGINWMPEQVQLPAPPPLQPQKQTQPQAQKQQQQQQMQMQLQQSRASPPMSFLPQGSVPGQMPGQRGSGQMPVQPDLMGGPMMRGSSSSSLHAPNIMAAQQGQQQQMLMKGQGQKMPAMMMPVAQQQTQQQQQQQQREQQQQQRREQQQQEQQQQQRREQQQREQQQQQQREQQQQQQREQQQQQQREQQQREQQQHMMMQQQQQQTQVSKPQMMPVKQRPALELGPLGTSQGQFQQQQQQLPHGLQNLPVGGMHASYGMAQQTMGMQMQQQQQQQSGMHLGGMPIRSPSAAPPLSLQRPARMMPVAGSSGGGSSSTGASLGTAQLPVSNNGHQQYGSSQHGMRLQFDGSQVGARQHGMGGGMRMINVGGIPATSCPVPGQVQLTPQQQQQQRLRQQQQQKALMQAQAMARQAQAMQGNQGGGGGSGSGGAGGGWP